MARSSAFDSSSSRPNSRRSSNILNEAARDEAGGDAIQEMFPPLLFLPNEDGKPSVALAPTLKSDELNHLLQRTRREDNPQYLIQEMNLNVVAEQDYALIQCKLNVHLLKSGLTVIPIRMGKTHITKSPTAIKRSTAIKSPTGTETPPQSTSSEPALVGIRLRHHAPAPDAAEIFAQAGGRDEWELILRGSEDDQLTIEFESQIHLHQLGNETHLRLELPRTKSEMRIRVPIANAASHLLTAGALSKAIPINPLPQSENAASTDEASADEAATYDASANEVSGGESDEPVAEEKPDSVTPADTPPNQVAVEDSTEFLLTTLPSSLDFAWYPQNVKSNDEKMSFEVEGVIEVEVDALEGLLSDATFTVTSFNKPIEAMIIRLPENTRLVETGLLDFGEYQLRTVDADSNGTNQDSQDVNRREVSVTLAEPSLSPPPIRLRVQAAKELTEFELAGFEVLVEDGGQRIDATVESGVVSVRSQSARRPKIQTGEFARRITGDPLSRGVESFEYSRPNQVRLVISRQSTELAVEPTYIVELEESRATLTAIFRCSQRGGSLDSLVIDLGEWSYFDVRAPGNVVDGENVRNDEELEIPLKNAPDSFDILVQARYQMAESLSAEARDLQLSFPVPRGAERILQAKVAVVRDESIVALSASSTDYSETEAKNVIETLADVQSELVDDELIANRPLCFLKRTSGAPAPLTLAVSKLPRRTDVECDIELTDLEVLNDSQIRIGVRQTLRWQVRNVPLQYALLKMHEDIYQHIDETANLAVAVDGRSRLGQNLRRAPAFLDAYSDSVSVIVGLDPQLGSFEMVLTYDWLHEDDEPLRISQRTVTFVDLPLVLPRQQSKSHDFMANMRLRSPRVTGYDVALALPDEPNQSWLGSTDLAVPNPDFEAILDTHAEQLPTTIPLEIRPAQVTATETEFRELVDRAWFQTWLTDSTRTDRAVFQLKGVGRTRVRVKLPSSSFEKLYAFVNGKPTDYSLENDAIELKLSSSRDQTTPMSLAQLANETQVIELQYWSKRRQPPGLLTTDVPRIEGADIRGQWYWHVVMPRNECMVTWPRSLTRAHIWDWSSILPSRRPQRSLADLENWSGAITTGDQVLAGSTEYLFGATGETVSLSIRTTLLPIYILSLAGIIFVFGVAMMYYRRRVLLLAVVGALIASLIFLHPSYASVAGQVAVFGLLLVVLMNFLRWLSRQTIVRRAAVPARDSGFDLSPAVRSGSSVVNNVGANGSTTLTLGSSRVTQE